MGAIKKTHKTRKDSARTQDADAADTKKKSVARPDEMPPDVLEFIHAIDAYKRTQQRPFPNWSEILEIVKSLGYQRAS
ncbi:MAG: hypothetical protein JNL28_08515 [Planctomycetes bacterium]|nr:hypothetical protein [Planctomycetota bacterium]